ncbi:MAG: peptidase S8 and S53 subtilisin kexin sedolisin [Pseudomonas palmensis]|uniref:subtilisin-like serine protease QhpE n=1 Tax=Pseudomonas palmensis TaxID=2815362 RepID=UPI003D0DA8E7
MGTSLRVGVIDSGCSAHQAGPIAGGRRFWLEHGELREGQVQADVLGHGSRVLDCLLAQGGAGEVLVAQVFDRHWQTSALQVAAALLWLVEQGAMLVNLSLGLQQDRNVLRAACAVAVEAGVLLCASSPARGAPVYPARYPGVIRVTGDARCAPGQWSWLDTPQADFGAAVDQASGVAGASLASAALCGQVRALLTAQPNAGREQVLAYLRQQAAFIGAERRGGVHG